MRLPCIYYESKYMNSLYVFLSISAFLGIEPLCCWHNALLSEQYNGIFAFNLSPSLIWKDTDGFM